MGLGLPQNVLQICRFGNREKIILCECRLINNIRCVHAFRKLQRAARRSMVSSTTPTTQRRPF